MRAKFVFLIFACFAISSLAMGQQGVAKHTFTVVIDAGHGGNDCGATRESVCEDDINLAITLKTYAILRSKGYEVYFIGCKKNLEYEIINKLRSI